MSDKVSVIVPIYNVERYLKKCVDSILFQDYENIEIILIDDCSIDSSPKIAQQYQKKYPDKVKFIQRKENGRQSVARNMAVKEANGTYLSFIDADDWIRKDFYSKMMKEAKSMDADITVCDYYMTYDDGKEEIADSLSGISNSSLMEEKIAIIRNHTVTKIFKKDFFDKNNLTFPENIKRGLDIGIVIPALTKANNIAIVNEPLYYYYQRADSNSNPVSKNEKIDLSFFEQGIELIIKDSAPGYDLELEYHVILELIYGKTMLMIRHKYSNKEVKDHLKEIDKRYPNWRKNKYINRMVRLKKLFIKIASYKIIGLLRLMVIMNERRKKNK